MIMIVDGCIVNWYEQVGVLCLFDVCFDVDWIVGCDFEIDDVVVLGFD